ncbi:hypothetical protein [Agromyces sp. GXQ0307]|uniref:hypothetical protein n=1 Tax=Agromyces sp. GXQ0307 TaxID=3377835 RepID=UPI003839DF17
MARGGPDDEAIEDAAVAAARGEPAPSAPPTADGADVDPVTDGAGPPWWRRRPPADHDRLARGIWWTGHVQLFIALALLVGCGALVIVGIVRGDQGLSMSVLGLAMAGPFALSGRMLRASSGWRTYWGPTDRRNWAPRAAMLVATVVGIAIVSIAATTVIAYLLLIFGWSWSWSAST